MHHSHDITNCLLYVTTLHYCYFHLLIFSFHFEFTFYNLLTQTLPTVWWNQFSDKLTQIGFSHSKYFGIIARKCAGMGKCICVWHNSTCICIYLYTSLLTQVFQTSHSWQSSYHWE